MIPVERYIFGNSVSYDRFCAISENPDCETANKWVLACAPCMVTLEDVFRCALSEQKDSSISPSNALPGTAWNDLELLLMQAMITINESVCRHLRRFSLDRLKAHTAGVFPTPRRHFSYASLDNDFCLPAPDRDATL